jgi:DNA-directed RNA polymerase beta' subunit
MPSLFNTVCKTYSKKNDNNNDDNLPPLFETDEYEKERKHNIVAIRPELLSSDDMMWNAVCRVVHKKNKNIAANIDRQHRLDCVTADSEYMGAKPGSKSKCLRCKLPWPICHGHEGVLTLGGDAFPRPDTLKELVSTLTVVCPVCAHSLINETNMHHVDLKEIHGLARLHRLADYVENELKKSQPSLSCTNCGRGPRHEFIVVAKEKTGSKERSSGREANMHGMVVYKDTKTSETRVPNPRSLLALLKQIPDYVAEMIGFESGIRPEALMLECLPICAIPARLPADRNGKKEDHEMTLFYDRLATDCFSLEENRVRAKKEMDEKKDEYDRMEELLRLRLDKNPANRTLQEKHHILAKEREEYIAEVARRNLSTASEFKDSCENYSKVYRAIVARLHELWYERAESGKSDNNAIMKNGMTELLKRKDGLFRNNMMGKRRNFGGRAVISPAPEGTRTDEVVLPRRFANKMTVEEIVTSENLDRIRQLMKRQKVQSIIPRNPSHVTEMKVDSVHLHERYRWALFATQYRLKYKQPTIFVGDIVARDLLEGDYVIVNRQPSLYRNSKLLLRVKFWDQITIGLSVQLTKNFNADFDGDEMNVHVPQILDVRAEVLASMTPANNIVSDTNNCPTIGVLYDGPTGTYLLSRTVTETIPLRGISTEHLERMKAMTDEQKWHYDDGYVYNIQYSNNNNNNTVRIRREAAVSGAMLLDMASMFASDFDLLDFHARLEKAGFECPLTSSSSKSNSTVMWPYYPGRAVVSLPFPRDMCYEDRTTTIVNGIVIRGAIVKGLVGPFIPANLIQVLEKDYSGEVALNFIDDITTVSNHFLAQHGFTVGVADCLYQRDVAVATGHVSNKNDPDETEERYERLMDVVRQTDDHSKVANLFLASRSAVLSPMERDVLSIEPSNRTEADQSKLRIDIEKKLQKEQDEAVEKVRLIEIDIRETTDETLKIELERKIQGILNDCRNQCATLVDEFGVHADNAFFVSSRGGKGSKDNTIQILGMLGQQRVSGQRPKCSMAAGTRTLPHFLPGDSSPESRGFVRSCFKKGMTPTDCFFHAWGSREGVWLTKNKTSDAGDAAHRIRRSNENMVIWPDGSVRDHNGIIIQQCYAGDGFASQHMELHNGVCLPSGTQSTEDATSQFKKMRQLPANVERIARRVFASVVL